MDTEDIFRRLTSGAKFNRQKLNRDLAFIRVSSVMYACVYIPIKALPCVDCMLHVREGEEVVRREASQWQLL